MLQIFVNGISTVGKAHRLEFLYCLISKLTALHILMNALSGSRHTGLTFCIVKSVSRLPCRYWRVRSEVHRFEFCIVYSVSESCCRYWWMCSSARCVSTRHMSERWRLVRLWMPWGISSLSLWRWVHRWVFYTLCRVRALELSSVAFLIILPAEFFSEGFPSFHWPW